MLPRILLDELSLNLVIDNGTETCAERWITEFIDGNEEKSKSSILLSTKVI